MMMMMSYCIHVFFKKFHPGPLYFVVWFPNFESDSFSKNFFYEFLNLKLNLKNISKPDKYIFYCDNFHCTWLGFTEVFTEVSKMHKINKHLRAVQLKTSK